MFRFDALWHDLVYQSPEEVSRLYTKLGLSPVGISGYFHLRNPGVRVERGDLPTTNPEPYVEVPPGTGGRWTGDFLTTFDKLVEPLHWWNDGRNDNWRPVLFLEFGYIDSVQAPISSSFQEFTLRIPPDQCPPQGEDCAIACPPSEPACDNEVRCSLGGAPYPYGDENDVDDDGVPDDLATQRNLLQGFFDVFTDIDANDHVQGAFFWDIGIADDALWQGHCASQWRGLSFRGKPAEDVVKASYGYLEAIE